MGLCQMGEIAVEDKPPGPVQGCEPFQEEPAEQPGEHAHGQEEAGPA
ncbi:hypothetical protein SAMN05421844_10419 [Bosea robiniae]|uniref:Uncharacterized protein n=1 Tax=Bosea robiniae TaxID=1036780 RepID=A0ABY0NZJ9_9HYPH|nr:hypothetical protein SAMN05421844_10419 [Bosea robiniae]